MRRELKFTRWCRVLQDKDSRCTGALQQMLPTINPFLIMLTIYEINLLRPAHSGSDFVMKCCNFLFTPTSHPPKECWSVSVLVTALTHSRRGQVFREEAGRKDDLCACSYFLKGWRILNRGFCQWRNCYLTLFYNNVSLHYCQGAELAKKMFCYLAVLQLRWKCVSAIRRLFCGLFFLYQHEGSLNGLMGEKLVGNIYKVGVTHMLWPHHFWHKTDHFLFATAVLPENGPQRGNSKYKSFPERGIAWTTIVLNHLARASSRGAMSWGEIFLGYHSSNIWRVGLGHI